MMYIRQHNTETFVSFYFFILIFNVNVYIIMM